MHERPFGEEADERRSGEAASLNEWTRAGLSWVCGIAALAIGALAASRVFAWCGGFLLEAPPPAGPLVLVGFTWFARTLLAVAPPVLTFVLVAIAVASAGALLVPSASERLPSRYTRPWSRR